MKSSDYNAAVEYLEYEHTNSGEVIKDEYGLPQLRDHFIIEGINCNPLTFNMECNRTNELYKKNLNRNDVKSHSYTISFDPRDPIDNGLTLEDVQRFGVEFVNKYMPGYQTIVCSHSDGSNGSGNMHCHIVINSIRIMDVERESYMDQRMDNLAGGKHRCTKYFERFIKARIMEMCQERGLYQVNLLDPAQERVNDREYYLNRKGKQVEGETYQTRKDYIRSAIRDCSAKCNDFQEFKKIIQIEYDIIVNESRGRLSFILPGRERGITERQLGSFYTKGFIVKVIRREEFYYDRSEQRPYCPDNYIPYSVRKLVDISKNEKALQSKGYEHMVQITNLKKTAETINTLSEKNIKGMRELETSIISIRNTHNTISNEIKSIESRINEIKTVLHLREETDKLKPVIAEMKSGKRSERFRKNHEGELIIYKASKEKLKNLDSDLKGFSSEELKTELSFLTENKNILYEQRSQIKKDLRDLENAKHNIERLTERGDLSHRESVVKGPSL